MAIRKYKGDGVIRRFFKAWPGEKRFGVFRYLPFFVFLGASMEFAMIHWTIGKGEKRTNFCKFFFSNFPLNKIILASATLLITLKIKENIFFQITFTKKE